jgi:hypothetical protein
VVSSTADRDGALGQGAITLRGNEGVLMKLAPDVAVPQSI